MGLFDKIKKSVSEVDLGSIKEKVDLGNLKEKVKMDNLKEKVANSKPILIGYVSGINYDKAISSVEKIGGQYPETIGILHVLKTESSSYNASNAANREDVFINNVINNIDPQKVLEEIKPIADYIPHGNHIVMLLRYLIKKKKN